MDVKERENSQQARGIGTIQTEVGGEWDPLLKTAKAVERET
jgi:hypothetical protein